MLQIEIMEFMEQSVDIATYDVEVLTRHSVSRSMYCTLLSSPHGTMITGRMNADSQRLHNAHVEEF